MSVLSKSQMSEEDIKFHYITPAITAKWDKQHITLETKITDGRINLKGNIVAREKPKRQLQSCLFRPHIKCTSTLNLGRELRTQKFIRCSFLCIR